MCTELLLSGVMLHEMVLSVQVHVISGHNCHYCGVYRTALICGAASWVRRVGCVQLHLRVEMR
jgi:hypothetical protein